MTDENGTLSIDFLAGFTIFMIAFIWVVSMIPGIMIGLQSYTIDYDAVAYRTGVILVEDPGWPASPGWESQYNVLNQPLKANITRFGLAISKDTPNILSEDKVNRFFCWSSTDSGEFNPSDYRTRAIFGDYPYGFNISLIDIEGQSRSLGDVLPDGFGTARRLVKIKGTSNATINNATYTTNHWYKSDNVTTHVFSILIDNPKLLGDVKDPAYQIDPAREQITINITDLKSTITEFPPTITRNSSIITLKNIKVYKQDGGLYSNVPVPASEFPYIDGNSARATAMPANVTDNVTLRFSPRFFDLMKAQNSQIYVALGFDVTPASTFLNNTQSLPDFDTLDASLTFNNPNTNPFNYNYDPKNVTQPYLRDAVVEVAIWSGSTTIGPIGGGGGSNISHTIYASAGSGGAISPGGSVIVSDGANQVFTITNNTGYHITDVSVDGWSNGTISSYVFNNVIQDHTITASFAINQYTITPSVISGNGTITPGFVQTVNYGATPTFLIAPNGFDHIADVSVDGTSVGTVTSYIFPSVTANHMINASFAQGPPPEFTSITPSSGPTAGGTAVTIVGSNFVAGGSFGVTIGGAAATSVVWVDSSHITAFTPAGTPGTQDVVITNGDDQTATGTGAYTYVAPPTFTSITPSSGPTAGGTAVTIVGSNFVAGGSFGVTIGGAAATSVVWVDSSHITAFTPAGTPGAKDVVITNNDDQTATGIGAYSYGAVPVAAFSGTPVSGNSPLTVQFTDASTGTITAYAWDFNNDGSVDSTSPSPTYIYATAGTYTVSLTVTGPGGSDVELKTSYITVYTVLTFTSSTTWTVPSGVTTVEYLVVAGGGGGGRYGAGGGAGGFRTGTLSGLSGPQTVTVGGGGAGGTAGRGSNGGNSVFASIIATGGGGGGSSSSLNGINGGSGGGATGTGTSGTGTAGQGNNGGTGRRWSASGINRYLGGGGGGASAAGGAVTGASVPYTGGLGGAGSYSSITGTAIQYAGGGGGGGSNNGGSTFGSGGAGGGGNGAVGNAAGSGGTANTGGGGGGGGSNGNGGSGGSGIVIIKFTIP